MTRKIPEFLGVVLLAATGLAGCNSGTGVAGIDGTGIRSPEEAIAYGRVTGFGSVWVNGVRYDTSTAAIVIDGTRGSQADLGMGDIVQVSGKLNSGSTTAGVAETVSLDHVVVGPIGSIEASSNSLEVLGQSVIVNAGTAYDALVPLVSAAGLAVGDRVTISGFRTHTGAITATRIGMQPVGNSDFRTAGVVTNVDTATQRFTINALEVDYRGAAWPAGTTAETIANGDIVGVAGSSFGANGQLMASRIEPEGRLPGDAGARMDIEGYITRFSVDDGTRFEIAGLPVATTAATMTDGFLSLNHIIEVEGELDSRGTVVASDVRSPVFIEPGGYTIVGYVFNAYTGPIAAATVNAFINHFDESGAFTFGYTYWWRTNGRPVMTDMAGNFTLTALPYRSQIPIVAFKEGFVQPCAAIPEMTRDLAISVELVAESTLNVLDPPRPLFVRDPTLAGTIFETTEVGRQPIAGADIWVDDGIGVPYATTITDLAGHYFLCSLPREIALVISKPGYALAQVWPIDWTRATAFDIELQRLD